MIVFGIATYFCLFILTNSESELKEVVVNDSENLKKLYEIQQKINNDPIDVYKKYDRFVDAAYIFRQKHYEQWICSDAKRQTDCVPVLILGMSMQNDWEFAIGNQMGNYFDSISCAAVTGTHFVGVKNFHAKTWHRKHQRFYDAFPDIIENPNPVAYAEAFKTVPKHCDFTKRWGPTDPWRTQMPLIRRLLEKGIYLHLAGKDSNGITVEEHGLHIDRRHDLVNFADNRNLPLNPDVAIHYRCSDNWYDGMGLMSFGTVINRIPRDAKSIYVFTEYGRRLDGTPLAATATSILKALFSDLVLFFPKATIVIKRGGNIFTVYASIFLAEIAICAPSTFSLWPAVARHKAVYMPATSYVGATTGFFIHEHFHWIINASLHRNFTKDTSSAELLTVLRSDVRLLSQ